MIETPPLSPLAAIYKMAEEAVIEVYRTKLGNNGLSQAWKIDAIKQDRISSRRSGIVEQFIIDVEATVDRLQKMIEEVEQQETVLEKLVGQTPQVEKKQAVKPPPNNAELGIDRDWD